MTSNLKSSHSILKSAGVMSIAVFLSRILGLVREQVFAALFGASSAMDAFQIAFRIPNLLRDLFAEGAMSAALVPTFIQVQNEKGRERAWQVATRVFVILFLVVSVIALLGAFFAPTLVAAYANAFRSVPGKFELTVQLTQVMMPFFPLVALAAAFMAILNACGKFFIPSFSSAMFNLVSVLFGVCFLKFFDLPLDRAIVAMAYGVVVGGFVQAAIQWPLLRKQGYKILWSKPDPVSPVRDPALQKMMFLMIPGMVGLAATQINILVNSIFATSVGTGAVSWLNYAFRLMQFPIGIFGVSLAAATLPLFSRSWTSQSYEEASETLTKSLKRVFAINFPAAFGLAFLGVPIIGLIFEHGRFSLIDTFNTAQALAAYAVGLVGYSVVKVLVPICYVLGETRLAVLSSFASVVLNLIFNFVFVKKLGFVGLALGTSLTSILNAMLLWLLIGRLLRAKQVAFKSEVILKSLAKYLTAAAGMGIIVGFFDLWAVLPLLRRFSLDEGVFGYGFRVGIGMILGIGVYGGLSILLKCQETLEVFDLIKRRLRQRG